MYALLLRACLAAAVFGTVFGVLRNVSESNRDKSKMPVYAETLKRATIAKFQLTVVRKENRNVPDTFKRCIAKSTVLLSWTLIAVEVLDSLKVGSRFFAAPYIKVCKKRDPDINKCIANSIEELRDKLAVGIPELEAPAIEPLYLKQIRLLRGPLGARLDVNITDLKVSGPSTFKVRDLKADVDNVIFTFKVGFEKLHFQGKYQIDARILLLRLSGNGELTGRFNGYDSEVVLKARKISRDNDVYLTFEKMKLKIKISNANLHLSNLFGGDTLLGTAGNELLNNNNALILDEITPVLESSLADLFTDVANKITKSFTYRELFPDE